MTDEPPTSAKGMVRSVQEVTDKALVVAQSAKQTTEMQEKNISRTSFVSWLNLLLVIILALVVFGLTWQVQSRNRAIDQVRKAVAQLDEATHLAKVAAIRASETADLDRVATAQALEELQKFAEGTSTDPEAQAAAARNREAIASISEIRIILEKLAEHLCGSPCLGG